MTRRLSKKMNSTLGVVMIICACLLLLGIVLVILEKTHVTNLIANTNQAAEDASGKKIKVNDIDYNPPSTEEKNLGDQIKSDAQKQTKDSTDTSNVVSVSLSAAAQDEIGGPIVMRSIVGTQVGDCSITLSGSDYTKSFSTMVENLETYYGCSLNIATSDMPAGSYTLTLSVANGSAKGSVSQSLEVRK